MAETTDGARIIAAGVPVTIAGQERRLRFGARALELIEEEFDGLLHFTSALNGGYRTKRIKAVRVGLLAGLEKVTPEDVGKMMESFIGAGFADLDRVHRAIVDAFDQAIPPPAKASKVSGQAKGSRGRASIAKPSSSSESVPESSAA